MLDSSSKSLDFTKILNWKCNFSRSITVILIYLTTNLLKSTTYRITHPALKPYVEYILFNKAESEEGHATSFSNNNICLGILNNSKLVKTGKGSFTNVDFAGMSSYLSGMYLEPHHFVTKAELDEICIDFTPLGYYKFFGIKCKKYILDEDVIDEGFGVEGKDFFEKMFQFKRIRDRGILIEHFLLQKLRTYENQFLEQGMSILGQKTKTSIAEISKEMGCSERKLQREVKSAFNITPKQYQRIIRFRKCLNDLKFQRAENLTEIAYNNGFNDQSHFVKEVNTFTGKSPSKLYQSLRNINDQVLIAV